MELPVTRTTALTTIPQPQHIHSTKTLIIPPPEDLVANQLHLVDFMDTTQNMVTMEILTS